MMTPEQRAKKEYLADAVLRSIHDLKNANKNNPMLPVYQDMEIYIIDDDFEIGIRVALLRPLRGSKEIGEEMFGIR